jgi:hypothetical protein
MSSLSASSDRSPPAAEYSSRPLNRLSHVPIVLFVLPISITCIQAYAPGLLSGETSPRVSITVLAHVMFFLSLFVLGGDFWDKLRALFVRDARVIFPEAKAVADDPVRAVRPNKGAARRSLRHPPA